MEQYLAPARAAVTLEAWAVERAAGRTLTQPEAIALLLSPGQPHDPPGPSLTCLALWFAAF